MIKLLKILKLNLVFMLRSMKALPISQMFRPILGAAGWWSPPARLAPKCLGSSVALRGNKFDYQVFSKVFVWEGYKNIVDDNTRFVIDAGANIGLSTVFFARSAPQALIVAIEPEYGNYEMLRENSAAFGCRIHPIRKALASTSGRLSLDDSKGRPDGYRFHEDACGYIEGLTIDEILRGEGWTGEIDLLKVDIEGGEYDLFLNSDLRWLSRVKLLVCEIHAHADKRELEQKIIAEGFAMDRYGEDTHFTRIS